MANFHPSDNTLVEYSAGNLDWALSICVSAHLQLCPQCKSKVIQYNAIGGSALNEIEPAKVEESSFDKLMSRIQHFDNAAANDKKASTAQASTRRPIDGDARTKSLPKVVQRLLPKDKALKWAYVSPALRAAQLETGQNKYEVSFHKIKRGGRVVEHDHGGLEVTLVLEGSFSDANGNYVVGDYIEKKPGEIHRPMAAQDQDCLCLSVVEAPVKVTGLMGKMINPFLRIHPR